MTTDHSAVLADLRHDVNAKCSNLKRAAANLRGESTDKELKLVGLMEEQARALAERFAAYAAALRGGHRK
ncbi:MAG: hypothetical protein AAB268_03825 [Elusimicrobiota bacterium]